MKKRKGKLSECEKGYRRWISPSNKPTPVNRPPTNFRNDEDKLKMEDLRKYIDEQARVADANSKEWQAAGGEVNAAYRAGMWFAYNDVRNRLPQQRKDKT